ncbi:hypothetical protein DS675_21775, partial [Salmonella enterica subsp. enterica serovar Infantis]|nr:hypothetical protein [Salmonella enterica subsp. enterica serovar Weltevreden]EBV4353297.1 hypothetical protein [Salmonella enterica subsp. enterica serovar Infantis]EBW3159789.1 hypothetical protein [Salmonella enterica subsp. enterica serovar Weltevreden]EBX2937766.1 hypothetical protein [Salmonella enterica subsp. enterica serovar Infantis]EBX3783897.1 hypothetical protein [Salmonella enterica subsp. enterica serovar Infantis]
AAARRASVASQTSRTTCTLRFLRAVRVQTGCANNAWWDRLLDCINRRDLWRANIAAGIKIFSVSTLLPQAVVIPLVGMSDG